MQTFVFSRRLWILWALMIVGSGDVSPTQADDWPQWLGPQRDGVWHETKIVDRLPAEPHVLWRKQVHGGYSGPAVAQGRVVLTDYKRRAGTLTNDPGKRTELQGDERVLCFDAVTGEELWSYSYDCPYSISYPCGPRCTPTIAGDRVYTLGAQGHLICLELKTGTVVWKKHLPTEYRGNVPLWGYSGHPLVDGDRLYTLAGGPGSLLVALHKETGKEIWRALDGEEIGYCPPSIIEAGGVRQLLMWTPATLNSLHPETGAVYWSQPLVPNYQMSIMAPRKAGDWLFASAIGSVGAAYKLDPSKPAATVAWTGTPKTAIYCANSTPIIDQGIIYGSDCQTGQFRAVKLETGDRLWETFQPTTGGDRRASHGTAFLVKHEDRYFLMSETGDLIIAHLSAEKYEEQSRVKLLKPTGECFGRDVVWSHPAFALRCVFARNDEEIVCVSLAKE